jgi:hypothetical protein
MVLIDLSLIDIADGEARSDCSPACYRFVAAV